MRSVPSHTGLLLAAFVALGGPAAAGQRPEIKKDVPTAFPNLKPPEDRKKLPEVLFKKFPLPIPADAPTLRKVQLHQANEGAACLQGMFETIAAGNWNPAYNNELLKLASEFYRHMAEVESDPSARAAWFEDRIVGLKAFEEYIRKRVIDGNERPLSLSHVRFQRLQAEADLLKLKDDAAKSAKPEPTPGRSTNPVGSNAEQKPTVLPKQLPPNYTAFPNLKALDLFDLKSPQFPSPERTENDNRLRLIQVTQVLEGAEHLRETFGYLGVSSDGPWYQFAVIRAGLDIYPAAAQLESNPSSRVKWHEALIQWIKCVETSTEAGYEASLKWLNGRDLGDLDRFDRESFYIHRVAFHLARFYRLGAEAELLKLNESLAAAAPTVTNCPTLVERRPRLLFRRWR